MNTPTVHAAEERLLDAALEQVLRSARSKGKAATSRWLVAAMVMLGLGVTALTMWMARVDVARKELQEPAPLPPPVRAEGRTEIEALPAETPNLIASLVHPADIEVLARFRQLRRLVISTAYLHIGPVRTGKVHTAWAKPPADLLGAVAQLPRLESLQLPYTVVSPRLLQPLAKCANLRELFLGGEHVQLDDSMIAALRAIPNLSKLHLDLVAVDAATIARLGELPIEELELSRCPGLDADAWQQLCRSPLLRRLEFGDLGRKNFFAGPRQAETFWRPGAEQLRVLATMPKLRALAFHGCEFADADLLELPASLTELRLWSHELTPEGLRALDRFQDLRRLDISPAQHNLFVFQPRQSPAELAAGADSVAAALSSLQLSQLTFSGVVTDALQQAIGKQSDLTDLMLTCNAMPPLVEIAKAPKLRRLTVFMLDLNTRLTVDELQPLRTCRSLRRLELDALRGVDEAAVKELLGPDVEIAFVRY